MTNRSLQSLDVGAREGCEYVLGKQNGEPVAVFVILEGIEVHFCFAPEVWGRTLELAKEFLQWAWANLDTPVLIGPVPARNRLALRLAKQAGFKESHYTDTDELIYLYVERPAA